MAIYIFLKKLLFELQFTRAIDPDSPEEKKSYSKTARRRSRLKMLRSLIFNKAATQTTLLSYTYEVCANIKIHFQENRQKEITRRSITGDDNKIYKERDVRSSFSYPQLKMGRWEPV